MEPGHTLGGRYVMRSRIAGGGMGEVWIAHDDVLDREVAVKVIRRELAADPEFAQRFHHEARTAARLSHSNIAQVHDFGRDAGVDYLVMEFVRGTSLADLIDRHGGLPPEQVVSLIAQAAAGLEAAHEAGVIHRDVKPANILVTEKGVVKLTDFGIARALGEAKMTRTGEVLGTAQYLAPEAALGHEVSGQADLYALAVVTYEALTGSRPFQADSAVTLAMKHINEPPPPLPTRTPAGIRDAVMQGLAKHPNQRQGGVGAFARTLRSGLTSTPGQFPVPSTHSPYRGPSSGAHSPVRPAAAHGASHNHYPTPQGVGYGFAAPAPRGDRPADGFARAVGWVWIALSLVVLLSFVMPWATHNGDSWTALSLTDAQAVYSTDSYGTPVAWLMLLGTIAVLGFGIPQALGKGHLALSIVALLGCLFIGMLWLSLVATVDGTDTEPSPLSTASGLWICLLAGGLHLPVIFTSLFKRR